MTTPLSGGAANWPRRVLLLALGLTALRLVAAASIHLTEDEAYYRLWAQHLQLGYLDHPPMIAWWVRAGEALFGDTPLGVRLLPTLASGLNTWLIGDLTLRLGAQPRTAVRAALWYNATLTVCLGGMLAIPDAPASLFWTVTLWTLARFWASRRAAWWLAAGLAAGLAVMSKYSGLFLAPGVLLWLALTPGGLAELKKPGPWTACLIAMAAASANVAWNAQHGWITFAKQFGRVAPHGVTAAYLAEFVGTQILVFTPLMAVYAAIGIGRAWRERAEAGAVHLALPMATTIPFAAYLLLHGLHDRVQGHWPVPLFGALAICAAVAADRCGETARTRLWRGAAPVFGLVAGVAALVLMALPSTDLLGRHDPTLPLRGWPQFARDVEARRVAAGAAWVGTKSYGVFAQLNAEHRAATPLMQIVERDRYWAQGPGRPDFARPGLVVDLSRRMKRDDILRCFAVVEPAGDITRAGGLTGNLRYTAFKVSGPRRDPWVIGCPDEISPGVWK